MAHRPRPSSTIRNLPTIQGHGGVGVVEAVGPEVLASAGGRPRDRSGHAACGQCYQCLLGRADRCQFLAAQKAVAIAQRANGTKIYGAGNIGGLSERNGGFRRIRHPRVYQRKIDRSLRCCTAWAAVASGTAMTLAPVEAGSNVAVWGGGPVGLSAVQGARIMGAAQIILGSNRFVHAANWDSGSAPPLRSIRMLRAPVSCL